MNKIGHTFLLFSLRKSEIQNSLPNSFDLKSKWKTQCIFLINDCLTRYNDL